MARLVFEKNYHVYAGPTSPANPAAPRLTEINAMTNITAFIPKDGFNPGVSNNRVDAGHLATAFNGELMGSHGAQLSIQAFFDDAAGQNLAYDLFGIRGWIGAIIVCWRAAAAVGQPAFVWPYVEAGSPQLPSTAQDTRQMFTAEFAVGGNGTEPNYRATVAA